jgi:LysM repeat protein
MTLCGEPMPLADRDVAEMLDREFTLMVNDQAQIVMWLKRAARYFPYIERRLKADGLPDDLKYVAVVESSLLTRVTSPAGASGPWQFMEATGRRYGLRKDNYFDDRRNPERATSASIAYLRDLYKMFGNWALSMAAYNCGERRVQQELAEQGVGSYYDLYLPQETMRYVFRVAAAKAVLQNPEAYGYQLPSEQLYQPLPADLINLNLAQALPLRSLAQVCATTPKRLREFNPELANHVLPKGETQLKVPLGQGEGLAQRLAGVRLPEEPMPQISTAPVQATLPAVQTAAPVMAAPANQARPAPAPAAPARPAPAPAPPAPKAKARREWVVKSGQTLSAIAQATGASTAEIRKANGLKGDSLKLGQKLIIP